MTPQALRRAAAGLVLGGALASAGAAPAQVRYAPPAAAAGDWSDQPPPDVDCGSIVLRLPAAAGAAVIPGPIDATLAIPTCRQGYAQSLDSARASSAWHGLVEVRSGRTLVALRPTTAPGSPESQDSLTLWLSIKGCRLSGARKVGGAIQVAIFRKPGCVEPGDRKK